MLLEKSEIRIPSAGYHQILKINGEWTTVERTKKQQDILNKLGLEVVYPYA